jgi:hypothetical protein
MLKNTDKKGENCLSLSSTTSINKNKKRVSSLFQSPSLMLTSCSDKNATLWVFENQELVALDPSNNYQSYTYVWPMKENNQIDLVSSQFACAECPIRFRVQEVFSSESNQVSKRNNRLIAQVTYTKVPFPEKQYSSIVFF